MTPEPERHKEKEESPKMAKTFTELTLNNTDVKWNMGRKEKEGSPARKSPQGKTSPSHRTPVRVRIEKIEKEALHSPEEQKTH